MPLGFVPQIRSYTPLVRSRSRAHLEGIPHWEIEVKHKPDLFAISLLPPTSESSLVALRKAATTSFFRLLFPLTRDNGGISGPLEIKYRYSSTSPEILEWVAILEEQPNGHRRIISRGSSFR